MLTLFVDFCNRFTASATARLHDQASAFNWQTNTLTIILISAQGDSKLVIFNT